MLNRQLNGFDNCPNFNSAKWAFPNLWWRIILIKSRTPQDRNGCIFLAASVLLELMSHSGGEAGCRSVEARMGALTIPRTCYLKNNSVLALLALNQQCCPRPVLSHRCWSPHGFSFPYSMRADTKPCRTSRWTCCWSGPEKATKIVRRLEHLPYKERLRAGSVQPAERRFLGDLFAAFQHLNGPFKHKGERFFICAGSDGQGWMALN